MLTYYRSVALTKLQTGEAQSMSCGFVPSILWPNYFWWLLVAKLRNTLRRDKKDGPVSVLGQSIKRTLLNDYDRRRLKCTIVIMRCLSSLTFHIFDFSTEQNSTKLDRKPRSQCPLPSLFFGLIGKTRWRPWPLNGWDIFDFFFKTADWNSKKLDRKQD